MDHITTYDQIKKEYCSLFSFKSHGPTLEVITPIATITDKFISVFITMRGDSYYVADGGWVAENMYEAPVSDAEKAMLTLLNNQYLRYFDINTYDVPEKRFMYYKKTDKLSMIPACVFDLANFISLSVNSNAVAYKEKREVKERDRFKRDASMQLKSIFGGKFNQNEEIADGLTFNGVVRKDNRLHLFEFVTGHTPHYFDASVKDALVNFQLLDKNLIQSMVDSKIAVFNEGSAGYRFGFQPLVVDLLHSYTTQPYITTNDLEMVAKRIAA